jgi:hypothetical protein
VPRPTGKSRMSAGGGFQFVVTTASNPRVKENQRLVRSHISRSRSSRKGPRALTSWINNDVGLGEQAQQGDSHAEKACLLRPLGNGLSFIRFPDKIHPRIIQSAASCKLHSPFPSYRRWAPPLTQSSSITYSWKRHVSEGTMHR